MNNVHLTGYLAKTPEVKYYKEVDGEEQVGLVTFTVAVKREFSREGQPDADFFPIAVYGKLAFTCARFLTKGKRVAIVGRLQTRTYDDDTGARHYMTEVIARNVEFLSPQPQAQEQQQQPARKSRAKKS